MPSHWFYRHTFYFFWSRLPSFIFVRDGAIHRDDGINDCAANYLEDLLYRIVKKGGSLKK